MPSLGLELFIYLMALQNQLTLKEGKPSILHPREQHPQPGPTLLLQVCRTVRQEDRGLEDGLGKEAAPSKLAVTPGIWAIFRLIGVLLSG